MQDDGNGNIMDENEPWMMQVPTEMLLFMFMVMSVITLRVTAACEFAISQYING